MSIKFCGATVIGTSSNAAWQEQISSMKVDLVEDESDGDHFTRPTSGTPMSFTIGGFKFDGLVQKWGMVKGTSGNPIYNVILYSPSEILEGVQLILDAYRGPNTTCSNLLNVFGFLESTGAGFGGSGKNESGIAWYKIKQGIVAVQLGQTAYASGIKFKGHTYYVDMGTVPNTPDFYRLNAGAFVSLNQALRTVFEDAGYDYIVCLEIHNGYGPHRIFFKTKDKHVQVPFGQIESFVRGKEGIESYEEGEELRNDITSGIIFGGDQETCTQVVDPGDNSVIAQYWGDQQSQFLVPFGLYGNPPLVEVSGSGNEQTVRIDASAIADIIGDTEGPPIYECTVLEMRFALTSFDAWSSFMALKRPEVAQYFDLDVFPSIFGKAEFAENPQALFANEANAVAMLTNNWEDKPGLQKLERLYNFVQNHASTYYGKQFIVKIPFWLKYYFEEETTQVVYNQSINGDGYYPDFLGGVNAGPLGLNYFNFNMFMNESGKFTSFIKFSAENIANADISTRNSSDTLLQDGDIYLRCNVDPQFIFAPAPTARVELSEPLWEVSPDPVGGYKDVADVLGIDPQTLVDILRMGNGEFPLVLHPKAYIPDGAALCLKSNEYTYGPWTKIGVDGKVKIEQNQGLVPWNYGGFDTMNLAAEAQLADIGTTSQIEGTGFVRFAGLPELSLGDELVASGPVVTGVDIEISPDGYKTTYNMKTQTPVYGSFSKQNAERMRRLGLASQDLRRTVRSFLDRGAKINNMVAQVNWRRQNNISAAIQRAESNSVFQAFMANAPAPPLADVPFGALMDTPGSGVKKNVQIASHSFGGSIAGSNAHDDELHKKTASMGIEGLLRPFSTDPNNETFAHHEESNDGINVGKINPFKSGHDMLWLAQGDSFAGYYPKDNNAVNDIRPLGLRGPVEVVGWGYDIIGKPIPNKNEGDLSTQNMSDDFLDDYMSRCDKWKAGPVDLRWDKWRKVWTMPGILRGTYAGSGKMRLEGKDDLIPFTDYFEAINVTTKKMALAYDAIKNVWYPIAAECGASTS